MSSSTGALRVPISVADSDLKWRKIGSGALALALAYAGAGRADQKEGRLNLTPCRCSHLTGWV